MDPRLEALAAAQGGYFTRGQAIDCGYRDRDLKAAHRAGVIVRLRHGLYAITEGFRRLDNLAKHRVVAFALADKLGPHVAISHTSACAAWELDDYAIDLNSFHLTRLDGTTGRREAGVVYHVGAVSEDDLREVGGRLIIEPTRAIVEAATISSVETSMVIASSGLRLEVTSKEQLEEKVGELARWQGIRKADIAIRLADKRCESVGEVRSLHLFWREAIPRPDLQYNVFNHDGMLVARTDFAWLDHRHLGEFDGMVKYGRLNRYKDEPGRAITDEKVREDRARAENHGMSRWTWPDLDYRRAHVTANTIRAAMEQSRRLYVRNATIIPL